MDNLLKRVTIKSWAEQDRPREKLLVQGRRALTDAELLAILIGSGSTEETAVELCRRVLHDCGNNLNDVSRLSVSELSRYKGIGVAKAVSIVAALELSRRRKRQREAARPILNSSRRVYEYLDHIYKDLPHEEFWVLFLGGGCRLIAKQNVGRGGVSFTPVDVRQILRGALEHNARGIVLTHNHPSGTLRPSNPDISLTKKLVEAAEACDLVVNDHLIFTNKSYYSFRDDGMLEDGVL
jgi:DNA repair protein radc